MQGFPMTMVLFSRETQEEIQMSDKQYTNYLFNSLVHRKIDRREFMGRMTAAGASAGLIGTMATTRYAQAATPKKGGRLVMGTEGAQAQDSLDPTKFYSTANLFVGFAVYDLLVNRDADLKAMPWLATSWESSADSSSWVFDLRKDVKFHDGKDFGADDVIYACGRHTAEDSESPAKSFMSQIESMDKLDTHQVRFNLKGPNADFPIVLSDTRVHITQAGYEDFGTTSPGTGPFKVKEFDPGGRYEFTRNDDYWGDGPYVDELEMVGIGDATARVNALIAGDINCLLQLDPIAIKLLESSGAAQVLKANSGAFMNLACMVDRAPTDDPDVRLAIKHCFDRQQIVDNVLKGFGSIGNDHPVAPIDPFYCSDIPQRDYDPDKARFHIKKAGLEDKPIDFYGSDVPGSGALAACQVIQEAASKTGVNLNLIQPPADSYWSAVWIQKAICASGWDARPVPDMILSIALQSESSYNETQWKNETFDKLLVEARGEKDVDKRKEMYCEMQRMIHDTGGHVTMAYRDYVDAAREEVMGIVPHGSGPLGFFQAPRTAWIDA